MHAASAAHTPHTLHTAHAHWFCSTHTAHAAHTPHIVHTAHAAHAHCFCTTHHIAQHTYSLAPASTNGHQHQQDPSLYSNRILPYSIIKMPRFPSRILTHAAASDTNPCPHTHLSVSKVLDSFATPRLMRGNTDTSTKKEGYPCLHSRSAQHCGCDELCLLPITKTAVPIWEHCCRTITPLTVSLSAQHWIIQCLFPLLILRMGIMADLTWAHFYKSPF